MGGGGGQSVSFLKQVMSCYCVADPGCLFRLPGPNFSSRKYDPGCFIADPDPVPHPDPDFNPSRIQESKRHRIPDPDLQHWSCNPCFKKNSMVSPTLKIKS
jgi:hypothetical protein